MKKELIFLSLVIVLAGLLIFGGSPYFFHKFVEPEYIDFYEIEDDIEEEPSSISLPSGNGYYNSLMKEAALFRFDFENYGINEDDEGLEIPKDETILYNSFGKLKLLQLSQEYTNEEKVLKSFTQKDDFLENNVRAFIEYIDESYLSNIYELVEKNHIWEARRIVGLAYKRLNLFDAPPLSNLEFGNRVVIDEILLLNLIFNDPRLLLSEKETLLKFIVLADSDKMDFEILAKLIKESEAKLIPNDIILYFDGIKFFYKKNYKSAFEIFDKIALESRNNPLIDLANIMKIRCVFWSQKWEDSPWLSLEEAKDLIGLIGEKILRRTLKTDVVYYLDSLNVTPFRKAEISPEINE